MFVPTSMERAQSALSRIQSAETVGDLATPLVDLVEVCVDMTTSPGASSPFVPALAVWHVAQLSGDERDELIGEFRLLTVDQLLADLSGDRPNSLAGTHPRIATLLDEATSDGELWSDDVLAD